MDFTYKILQYSTTGWEIVHSGLTKDQAKERLEAYMSDGVNPTHLKVINEQLIDVITDD